MNVPYYGEIAIDGEPFCESCSLCELELTQEKFFSYGVGIAYNAAIRCANIGHCRKLYARLERQGREVYP